MTCEHCDRARRGLWGSFDMNCLECKARCVARSMAAWNALHVDGGGDVYELRNMIGRVFPQISKSAAKRMVWNWWCLDHGIVPTAKEQPEQGIAA